MVTAVVGLVSLFFLAAYFEKRKLISLSRAGSDAPAEQSGRAGARLHAAEALGFKSIGYLLDREGVKSSYVTLLLSRNDRVLVSVSRGIAGKFKLMSKLSDARWLITSEIAGEPDLSDLRIEAQCRGTMDQALAQHLLRLSEVGFAGVPFDPNSVVRDLLEHDRTRAERLIVSGYARWRYVDKAVWSYTITGSVRIAMRSLRSLGATIKAAREAAKAGKQLQ